MEEDKKGNGRKGLLATIIILCVVVIMIAVVVVAIIIKQKQDSGEVEQTETVIPEELASNDATDPDYIFNLEEYADNLENTDEGISLYEALIAKNQDNVSAILSLRIAYSSFLLHADRVDEGLEQLNILNNLELEPFQRLRLYNAYCDYYVYLEDDEKTSKCEADMYKFAEENGLTEEGEY